MSRKRTNPTPALVGPQRLQRVMAAAGIGSRRECEIIIEEGRVEGGEGVLLAVDAAPEVLGMLSALAYTAANLGLRNVAPGGDLDWAIFVSANKAMPVALIAKAVV